MADLDQIVMVSFADGVAVEARLYATWCVCMWLAPNKRDEASASTDLTDDARATLHGLCAFELDVLVDLAAGRPRSWGAAIGQAYEVLIARNCMTETFAITPLGDAVSRLIAEDRLPGDPWP